MMAVGALCTEIHEIAIKYIGVQNTANGISENVMAACFCRASRDVA